MRRPLLALLILLAPMLPASAGGPAEAVAAAWADAQKLPVEIRPHVRYLTEFGIPEKERASEAKAHAFHVNQLSREPDLAPLVRVTPSLVRVNLKDFGWTRETWERLAEVEPYFHAKIEAAKVAEVAPKVEEERVSYDGGVTWQTRRVGGKQVAKKEEKKAIAAHAPWLPSKEIAALALALNSDVPIARADWFLWQTATQHEKGPGYYDFLGLGKKEEDFQELIGADVKLAKRVKKEIAAVVARSGVTLNNRSMERFQTINGPYWRTQDFKTNILKQNVIRLLDGDTDPPKGDASEQYGTLPNGLFAFWLQNDKGERQDAAPDFIASDAFSTSTDRRVRIGIGCVRCHEEGIKPISDWMRAVYRGPVQLAATDYDRYKRLQRLYLSDLEGHVVSDRAGYEKALKRLNGLTAKENAQGYAKAWARYIDTDLSLDDVAREAYVEKEALVKILKEYAKPKPELDPKKLIADPVLIGLLADPPQPIRREHFEEVYSLLQEIIAPARTR